MPIVKPEVRMSESLINDAALKKTNLWSYIRNDEPEYLEHSTLMLCVSDKMFTFLRKFIAKSTELNYFTFSGGSGKQNIVSANIRAWYNLYMKNVVPGSSKQCHDTVLCKLTSLLSKNYPFFEELQKRIWRSKA